MKLIPWLVVLSFLTISCSGSKNSSVAQEGADIELADTDEFIDNPTEAIVEEQPVVAGTQLTEEAQAPVVENAVPTIEEASAMESNQPMIVESSSAQEVLAVEKEYRVQKNETLMIVAFKLYGDYDKWRELANYNSSSLHGSTLVKEGTVIKYLAPAEEFVWNPEGLPYLIRTGDTLGGISGQVYGTVKRWRAIWDNNKPLIKDPNRIFAGFTIYYIEKGRGVAESL